MKRFISITFFCACITVSTSWAQTQKTDSSNVSDIKRFKLGKTHFTLVTNKKDSSSRRKDQFSFGLYNESDNDSTNKPIEKHKPHKDSNSAYWSGFEMGFTSLLNSNMSTSPVKGFEYLETDPGKSITVQLNLFERTIPIYKHYVQLVTGVGIEWNNFRFLHSTVLIPGKDAVSGFIYNGSEKAYALSKLVTDYINVPLLLEFNTSSKPKHNIHLAGGVVVGWLYRDHTKQTYFENGQKIKEKSFDSFNLNPFRYSLSARLGYGNLNVFANYGLNGLFRDGHGPELHPFTIGITIAGL